jgi:hypothetical protein
MGRLVLGCSRRRRRALPEDLGSRVDEHASPSTGRSSGRVKPIVTCWFTQQFAPIFRAAMTVAKLCWMMSPGPMPGQSMCNVRSPG